MQPQNIPDGLMMSCPDVIEKYMVPLADIPAIYPHKQFFTGLQQRWFFQGLLRGELPRFRQGVDGLAALRHLTAVQTSMKPSHEHKKACVAYLMSLWFEGPETVSPAPPAQQVQTKKPISKGRQKRRR